MTFLKRFSRFEILLVAVLMLTHLVAALMPTDTMLRWYTTDDAFYYFKVAQNISEGHGSTFDGFGLTNGYHPLWMLVCVPVFSLARFDIFLPLRVLIVVLGVLHAATGLLLYRTVRKWITTPVAMSVAVLWVFAPFVHRITAQNGLEAGISAFFLVLTISLLAELKPDGSPLPTLKLIWIGAAGALTVMARLDNVFVILLLGVWLVFRSSPVRYYLSLDLIVIALSVWLSYMARFDLGDVFYQYKTSTLVMVAVGLAFKFLMGYFLGSYQPPLSMPLLKRLARTLLAVATGSAGTAVVMLGLAQAGVLDGFPRLALVYDLGISFLGIAAVRVGIDWLARGRLPVSGVASPVETLRREGKGWLRSGLIYYGILGGVLVAYMGWSYAVFGTPMPVSGQIKAWWGANYTIYGRPTQEKAVFFGLDTRFFYAQAGDSLPAIRQSRRGPWATALSWLMPPTRLLPQEYAWVFGVAYAAIGLGLLKSRRTGLLQATERLLLLPLLAGCLIQVWTYSARGYVAMKEWYWVGELLFTCLAAGTLLNGLVKLIPPLRNQKIAAWACLGIVCLLVSVEYAQMVQGRIFPSRESLESESYLPLVAQVEGATEPGAVIGLTGGGDMAYFIHDRTVVNLDGLINSNPYFTALKNQQATAYLASIGLDYVYGKGAIFTENFPYRKIFKDHLEQVTSFEEDRLYRFLKDDLAP